MVQLQYEDDPLSPFILHELEEDMIPNKTVIFVFLYENLSIRMYVVTSFSVYFA